MIRLKKIRSQLQVTLGLLVLGIIAISGFFNYNSAKESLFKNYYEADLPLVILNSAKSKLQAILERAIETSELLAQDPALISWFTSSLSDSVYKKLSLQRLDELHKNNRYATVFAVNSSTLEYWQENYTRLDVLSEDDGDDSWYFDAIKGNKKTTLNFDYNSELDETVLFINVLMYKNDEIVGVSGVGIDPSILIAEFEKQKLSKRSDLWLVDAMGKVIMSSEVNEINKPLSGILSDQLTGLILENKDKGIISEPRLKKGTDVAYLRLSDTEYKLVMRTPHNDLFPILRIIRNQTFWFSLIFLLVTFLVVGVLAQKITKPLLGLQHISEQVAKGNLEVKISDKLLDRKDEVGLLANAFDSMKDQLSNYLEKVNNANEALNNEKEQLKKINSRLNVALLKASESERLTQSFLANISHEIRTPMNSILGFSQLLETVEADSDDYREYVRQVIKGGQQLLTILDSIINLSKIESGVVKPVLEPISINKILIETFELYKVLAQRKDLIMHLELDEKHDDLEMVTDRALFQLVLNNLLSNAIKYTNEGFVNLGYRQKDEEIEFYVSDTGIGIATENIEAVFKPFRQVNMNHAETSGGAGLGLAIVKKILVILNGRIQLHSELGRGSTFYITMPLK